ncbi:MAG: tRNA (N(6)-L-threonylcarbamoyladenosine(37)-C(2))-methylthiotransferase MtaB [Gammaproteobacteria bacterium]|nr:tRNA (N(6)-L-threonylcarbamoyladenosine(37)-C(2))-methylthiotransferase MtaB [Gammaproteobacteria bacterium]
MQIHLKTLGCRLNEAELETWSREFAALGHRITGNLIDADLVVINSCAVTGEAVRKSRKLMRKAHRSNPRAKLVVSGCFASLNPDETADTLGVDLVVENGEKDRLVEITSKKLELHTMPALATLPGQSSLLATGRQRAFVKVQDGCRYQCTFCIVTQARGEERSRGIGEIIEEINHLHSQGINEVALTGVHLGGYGSDCNSDIGHLIRSVLAETDIPRLRLGAIEPWDLPPDFWDLFTDSHLMPHLHLPLQSGSDTVLRRMARRCKTTEFQGIVEQARDRVPDFNLTTDVIVGFPGETEDEWQQTLAFVEQIGFGHLHIFAFSPRPGTRAATLPYPVPRELIRERSQALHALGQRLKRDTLSRYLGRSMKILVEDRPSTGNSWNGYTPNFLRVALGDTGSENLTNRILGIRLTGLSPEDDQLIGEIEQT